MEEKLALSALAALAQETRLAVFRLLVPAGPNGLAAGEVAHRLGVPASTLSFHLKELERAGLLRSWRVRRQIRYAADYEGMRRLLSFLTEDCCQGHPEICGYTGKENPCDGDDLPQPGLRDVAQRPGDDPQQRSGAADRRVPEDAARPG